jgi:DNA-binding SARP family transcriptional activator
MHSAAEELLHVTILGQSQARRGQHEILLGPPRQQALLCILAMRSNRVVSREEIVASLWDEDPPPSAEANVRTYAARLRHLLDPARADVLASRRPGYLLRLDPDRLDANIFVKCVREARKLRNDNQLKESVRSLESAFHLWRGHPLPGVPGPFAETQRIWLSELRATAIEEHAELMITLGRLEITPELHVLIREHSFRERLRTLLMLALYRRGQQADALNLFQETRRMLIEQLGVEPGQELRRMHQRILDSDPSLDHRGIET